MIMAAAKAHTPWRAWRLACAILLAAATACNCSEYNWTVCVLDRPPISMCNVTFKDQPEQWVQGGGYAVRLFERVFKNAFNATDRFSNATYHFECTNEPIKQVVDEELTAAWDTRNRTCDVVIGCVRQLYKGADERRPCLLHCPGLVACVHVQLCLKIAGIGVRAFTRVIPHTPP
jgi:hypothetical protein